MSPRSPIDFCAIWTYPAVQFQTGTAADRDSWSTICKGVDAVQLMAEENKVGKSLGTCPWSSFRDCCDDDEQQPAVPCSAFSWNMSGHLWEDRKSGLG